MLRNIRSAVGPLFRIPTRCDIRAGVFLGTYQSSGKDWDMYLYKDLLWGISEQENGYTEFPTHCQSKDELIANVKALFNGPHKNLVEKFITSARELYVRARADAYLTVTARLEQAVKDDDFEWVIDIKDLHS